MLKRFLQPEARVAVMPLIFAQCNVRRDDLLREIEAQVEALQ